MNSYKLKINEAQKEQLRQYIKLRRKINNSVIEAANGTLPAESIPCCMKTALIEDRYDV